MGRGRRRSSHRRRATSILIEVAGGIGICHDGAFVFIQIVALPMPFIPLPFVVALLLLVLLATVLRRDESVSRRLALIVLIVISIWQSVLSGLRWGYDVQAMMFLAPVGPALVPPLAYASVENLVRGKRPWGWRRYGVHGLPALAIVLLLILAREAIDVALIAIFVGYALAILRLMRPGTDALRLAPFEGAAPAYRASLFTALCLLLSAAVDLFVVLDLAWAHGAYVRPVIAIANLCLLVILAIAAASTGAPPERVSGMPSAPDVPVPDVSSSNRPAPEAATAEEAGTMDAIERLMQTKRVYRDVDLNLDRLARKARIPARQISAAINRATGKNVSQTPDRNNRYRAMIGRSFLPDSRQHRKREPRIGRWSLSEAT